MTKSIWFGALIAGAIATGALAQGLPPAVPSATDPAPRAPFATSPPPASTQGQGTPAPIAAPARGPSILDETDGAAARGGARGQAPGAPPARRTALPPELDPTRAADLPPLRRSVDPTVPLGQIQPAWRDPVPSPGQASPGILRVRYERDRVVQLRTRVHMSTTITLPSCEKIEDVYPGDNFAFEFLQSRDNVVIVRPVVAGADTTLTLVSSAGNTYSFYVRSEAVETSTVSDVSVFVEAPGLCRAEAGRVVRPTILGANGEIAVRARGGSRGAGGDWMREIPFDMSKLDFDCCRIFAETEADAAIAPVRVFSDGVHTYVDFGERSDRIQSPAAFIMRGGIDQPVNTRVVGSRGQILVVEAIGDISLKSGEKLVCIRRVDAEGPPSGGSVIVGPDLGRPSGRRF